LERTAQFFTDFDGPIDHVFVSAGGPFDSPLADLDVWRARDAVARSVAMTLQLAKVAAPRMNAGGTLLFMGGTSARAAAPGMSVINAVMGATSAMIKSLALEVAPVRINQIAAGFVDTPLSARLLGDGLEQRRADLREQLPIRRVVTADDVAALALHVMNNTAMTGAVLDIDGGQQLLPPVSA
jgi:NAD(P)-dependent dehydrogenase (short-subunit alcohol dehydrogenase family)